MRKSLLVFATLLPLVLIAPPSSAAVKAGSACTKQGAKQISDGKSFTCIKQGKKLVFSKGVTVKKSATPVKSEGDWKDPRVGTPCKTEGDVIPNQIYQLRCLPASSQKPGSTDSRLFWFQNNPPPGGIPKEPVKQIEPTPAPTVKPVEPTPKPAPTAKAIAFTPWGTIFDAEEMTKTAIAKTSEALGTVKPSNAYTLYIDPAITATDREWITKVLDYTNGAFSNILQGRVKVFLGTTHAWSLSTVRSAGTWFGDPSSPFPCSNGTNDAYCAGPDGALLIYSDIYKPNSTYQWDGGRRSTPAHELFHTVQKSLNGHNLPPGDPTYIPRWLNEGSANYFGLYVVDKLALDTYQAGRKGQVNANQAYRTVTPLIQYDNFTSDPYGIGQAASEYLIASVGFENFLNIWKFTKSEGSFNRGFAKAIGIELSDFYAKFEAARASMKIGTE
jgi:hypothetical protein